MSSRKMTFSMRTLQVGGTQEFGSIHTKSNTDIERIEEKREMNPDMDAIYILSPKSHIVDCLMADFERRRYKRSFLVWIALLDPQMRRRIDSSRQAQEQLAGFETLSIDYFPRESHLITFRDPWSFPILYHPACNNLVRDHMQLLAQKVGSPLVSQWTVN
jgi:syntaxin-binding protein 1